MVRSVTAGVTFVTGDSAMRKLLVAPESKIAQFLMSSLEKLIVESRTFAACAYAPHVNFIVGARGRNQTRFICARFKGHGLENLSEPWVAFVCFSILLVITFSCSVTFVLSSQTFFSVVFSVAQFALSPKNLANFCGSGCAQSPSEVVSVLFSIPAAKIFLA